MAIYSWGANSHGQLGLGFESELCVQPQLLTKYPFSLSGVRSIRGGGGHVLVLDNCGRIHSCGWNNRGQLGLDSEEELANEFRSVPGVFFDDDPVESIACGWDTSACITTTKRLYVWGSNIFEQLGICQRGFNSLRRPIAVTLPRGDAALRCSFGLRHCAVLTTNNKIYIFGRLRINFVPEDIALTSVTINRAAVVKIIPKIDKTTRFASLASGQNHLLIKLSDAAGCRRVIALGDNKFGQSNGQDFSADVKNLTCGWTHNAVLLNDQRILLWGRNTYGQLGTGSASDSKTSPCELTLPETITPAQIHLGSEHSLVRSKEGAVFTWGWNEHGNCGNGTAENLYSPMRVELPGPCKVAGTGAGFCYAICNL